MRLRLRDPPTRNGALGRGAACSIPAAQAGTKPTQSEGLHAHVVSGPTLHIVQAAYR